MEDYHFLKNDGSSNSGRAFKTIIFFIVKWNNTSYVLLTIFQQYFYGRCLSLPAPKHNKKDRSQNSIIWSFRQSQQTNLASPWSNRFKNDLFSVLIQIYKVLLSLNLRCEPALNFANHLLEWRKWTPTKNDCWLFLPCSWSPWRLLQPGTFRYRITICRVKQPITAILFSRYTR